MDNSLTRWKRPFFKILFSRNSQSSVWNTNIFPDKVYQFFALRSHYTGDTAYRVWFDLDNSLTRWKRIIFKIFKIRNSRNSQNSVWKRNFFPGRAILRIIFPLHFHYSGYNQCRVWFYLHNSLTRWKRIIFKIRYSRNSQNFVWEPNLFPRQALRKFFALHSHYTGDTPYCVWFDLDNSLTRWKRPNFKIPFSQNWKNSVWKSNYFAGQAIAQILLLYTVVILLILNAEFGLIWITPWPYEKELFLKFSKVRNSWNLQNSVRKINFLYKI